MPLPLHLCPSVRVEVVEGGLAQMEGDVPLPLHLCPSVRAEVVEGGRAQMEGDVPLPLHLCPSVRAACRWEHVLCFLRSGAVPGGGLV